MTWDVFDRDYQDWCNSLVEHAPEHYDGDEAQEAIVVRYVRDLEALRDAVATYFDHPTRRTVGPVLAALDVCLGNDPDVSDPEETPDGATVDDETYDEDRPGPGEGALSFEQLGDLGIVQEVNRQLLHPIGLAMARYEDGRCFVISDPDPGGWRFDGFDLRPKAETFAALQAEWHPRREAALGYVIQPLDGQ